MKVSLSEHLRLESNARNVLQGLKHSKKISEFRIEKISNGEIKVSLHVVGGRLNPVCLQLRSAYGRLDIERMIKAKLPVPSTGESQGQKAELVVA